MARIDECIENIRTAIGAHGVWKLRLRTAISTGKETMTPAEASCDDKCDFGKWLYNPNLPPELRNSPHYADVRAKHAAFHTSVGHVLQAATQARPEEASKLLDGVFSTQSRELVTKMHEWVVTLRAG